MTARQIIVAWVLSLVAVVATAAGLLFVPVVEQVPVLEADRPVVFIGSSLTRRAVPIDAVEGGILGDGRGHTRWAANGMSEHRSLTLLQAALDHGAATVFVQIKPFAYEFASNATVAEPRPHIAAMVALQAFTQRMQDAIDALQGNDPEPIRLADASDPDFAWVPERSDLSRLLPFRYRAPSSEDELAALIRDATAQGTEVIFLELPLPMALLSLAGPDAMAATGAHLREVATRHGGKLMHFDEPWPDALFIDTVHLSQAGRAQFLAELSVRYEALQ